MPLHVLSIIFLGILMSAPSLYCTTRTGRTGEDQLPNCPTLSSLLDWNIKCVALTEGTIVTTEFKLVFRQLTASEGRRYIQTNIKIKLALVEDGEIFERNYLTNNCLSCFQPKKKKVKENLNLSRIFEIFAGLFKADLIQTSKYTDYLPSSTSQLLKPEFFIF